MRTMLFAFWLFAFLPLKADYGSCTVYKVRFFMKNGERIVGHFEVSGFESAAYGILPDTLDKDKAVYFIVKNETKKMRTDSFTFFKQIHYPKHFRKDDDQFGAVAFDDILKIAFRDIKFTVFINSERSKRVSVGMGLLVTSKGVIDTLNNKRAFFTKEFGDDLRVVAGGQSLILFNYNPKINQAEIERLYNLKSRQLNDEVAKTMSKEELEEAKQDGWYDSLFHRRDTDLINWFREKGVIVIAAYGSC